MKLTGLIFAFSLGLMAVACTSKPTTGKEVTSDMVTNNPATASSKAGDDHSAIIKFEKDTHNFGKLIDIGHYIRNFINCLRVYSFKLLCNYLFI